MKKIIAAAIVAGMCVSGLGLVAIAADCGCAAQERGYLSVSTTANTEVSPDVAEINIAIKTKDGKSLQKAAAENKLVSDNVYAAIKAMINTANGDYVKTADYNARPVYTYTSNNKKVLDKYEVSNNIIVHTKNIEQVGNIIDKAISLGATDVNSLRFSVSSYEKQCNDLLVIASNKAKARADATAKASGSYVTGVKHLGISCSENNGNFVQYRMLAKNMAAGAVSDAVAEEAPATPIQSGVVKIYANLNAEYFVK